MSVNHAQFNFALTIHGTPEETQWERPIYVRTHPGVQGEAGFIGKRTGRFVILDASLTGFNSCAALLFRLGSMQKQRGRYGELTITVPDSDVSTYPKALLLEVNPVEKPWLDASGVNGWQCDIQMKWRETANE